jgi:hypothetical protein
MPLQAQILDSEVSPDGRLVCWIVYTDPGATGHGLTRVYLTAGKEPDFRATCPIISIERAPVIKAQWHDNTVLQISIKEHVENSIVFQAIKWRDIDILYNTN